MNSEEIKGICEILDLRYVRQNDCASRHERTEDEINEIKMQLSDNTTKLNLIIKIGAAAAVGAIGSFAAAISSLILK